MNRLFDLEQEVIRVKNRGHRTQAKAFTWSGSRISTALTEQLGDEFKSDPLAFMGKYHLNIRGGMSHRVNGNENLFIKDILPKGFSNGKLEVYTSLNAPLVYAHFNTHSAANAKQKKIIPALADTVNVSFGNQASNGLPIYLVPYAADRSFGVQLPKDNGVNPTDAYAITANLSGCTVEISGPDECPIISHSNVNKTSKDQKQEMMSQRLESLLKQERFEDTKMIPEDEETDLFRENRLNFGYFIAHNPSLNSESISYTEWTIDHIKRQWKNLVNSCLRIKHQQNSAKTIARLNVQAIEIKIAPNAGHRSIIVAHRHNKKWVIYHQEIWNLAYYFCTPNAVRVSDKKFKKNRIKYIDKHFYMNLLEKENIRPSDWQKTGTVVLNKGRLWPSDAMFSKKQPNSDSNQPDWRKRIKVHNLIDLA